MSEFKKAHERPWKVVPHKSWDKDIFISSTSYPEIIRVDNDDVPTGSGRDTADLLVKAVNNYDRLRSENVEMENCIEFLQSQMTKLEPLLDVLSQGGEKMIVAQSLSRIESCLKSCGQKSNHERSGKDE